MLGNKYDTINLFLETYNYDVWFENEEPTDKEKSADNNESADLLDMPPVEDDKEVK